MPSANLLTKQRSELAKRLKELKPLHDEYLELVKASEALKGAGSKAAAAPRGRKRGPGRPRGSKTKRVATKKRGPGRPRGSKTKRATAKKRGPGRPPKRRGPGRPRGSGGGKSRANEALALVKKNPGITVPQIAKKIGIRQNYLYRVMSELSKNGSIKRIKSGYHPAKA